MPTGLDAMTPEARELLAKNTLAAVRRYLRSQREKEESVAGRNARSFFSQKIFKKSKEIFEKYLTKCFLCGIIYMQSREAQRVRKI